MTALQPRRSQTFQTTPVSPRATPADYLSLVKPRIIELLLVTTFPVMFLAERGIPPVALILLTLAGGSLSAASANVLNCYFDRDIDRLMHRTERRPLVTGAISPRRALAFGLALGVVSTLVLGLFVNALAAALSIAAIGLYVVLYTLILKRRTSQNIVWGGIAGCMPVLIGWAAVTNSLAWEPVVLFFVVFFWTPPHYWPLSMRFRDDYAAAGVPMLPVVAQDSSVARQCLVYTWATVATSVVLVPVGGMGWLYVVAAAVAGVVFLREAYALLARSRRSDITSLKALAPMRMFHYSITYLTLLFVAVALDPLVHLPLPF